MGNRGCVEGIKASGVPGDSELGTPGVLKGVGGLGALGGAQPLGTAWGRGIRAVPVGQRDTPNRGEG